MLDISHALKNPGQIYPLEAEAEPFWELRKKDSGHIKILYEIGGEEK